MTRALACACAAWLVLAARDAGAHDLRPGVVSLIERAPGDFELRFVAPVDNVGEAAEVTIELPAGCTRAGARVRCADGLTGALTVRGMRGAAMRTIVQLDRLDGARAEWILDAEAPTVAFDAAPPRTWTRWIGIGAAHVLGGIDHLAFVIGLLLVLDLTVGRRLLLAITAFTLGHSLTLALASLGVVHVATAPVEACIAASVLLVAREAMHRAPTLTRRWPWLVAGGFGLIHGLGFASALGDVGLDRASLVPSLVWFNVGVELGQLAVVAACVGVAALGRRLLLGRAWLGASLHRTACYALGGLAAWWWIARAIAVAAG